MNKRISSILRRSLIFYSLLAGAPGFALSYNVVDLGLLVDAPGSNEARPNGINHQQQLVAANASGGQYRALLYSNSWTDLGTLGGSEALAAGLNNLGQVVGRASVAGGSTHAFLWTPGATGGIPGNRQMKDLGTLGGTTSQAESINRNGQVTGYSDTQQGQTIHQHAFVYSGTQLNDIGTLLTGGLPNSYGYSINSAGHVAGTAYDALYTWPRAFFYNGATAKDIGDLGGVAASALSINDSDHIAGYVTTADFFDHAFHFSNGVMTDLGTLGGHYSYAISINNSNTIVGGSFTDDLDSDYHAFIWTGNTMQDLNNLLQPGTGWLLGEARCINDLGQIAGTGTYNGEKHAFLLEPTSTAATFRITSIQKDGANVVLRFPTLAQATYAVEANQSLPNNAWSTVVSGLAGNGGTLSVTNSISAGQTRFFRVKQTQP